MNVRRLYPGGKRKAFNITYDDGVVQDERFVELLNCYGLKGTFNLNSGLLRSGFTWIHECGMEIRRLPEEELVRIYQGHEIASHTLTHPYMHDLGEGEILGQMVEDKNNLEEIFGREVAGFAVPFTYYSDLIASCARRAGFEYARISEEGATFVPPQDRYWWRAGVFHWSQWMTKFVNEFLCSQEELAVCQIAGHSYDLDVMNMWETMENICRKVSACGEVWPATHIELVRYLRAMESLECRQNQIYNASERDLWLEINGNVTCLKPGESCWE